MQQTSLPPFCRHAHICGALRVQRNCALIEQIGKFVVVKVNSGALPTPSAAFFEKQSLSHCIYQEVSIIDDSPWVDQKKKKGHAYSHPAGLVFVS